MVLLFFSELQYYLTKEVSSGGAPGCLLSSRLSPQSRRGRDPGGLWAPTQRPGAPQGLFASTRQPWPWAWGVLGERPSAGAGQGHL